MRIKRKTKRNKIALCDSLEVWRKSPNFSKPVNAQSER